jgi:hypothetical protein
MPPQHKKALQTITLCRTSEAGLVLYECEDCGQLHSMFRSCGNRHCPICQGHKTRKWLEKQMKRALPGHHFMITFTVPQELRRLIRTHQRRAYSAFFNASSQTIKAVAANKRFIGGDLPGFFGVLHTWGRQLQFHPHIHYVVTGGAMDEKTEKWHMAQPAFFAPVKVLSKIFRAKMRDEFKKIGLLDQVNPAVWKKPFNVNCQAMDNPSYSIKYLAPYVFKVAISNSRIIKVQDGKVWFRYKKPRSNRWRIMSLDIMEFMRRFLQHVLPQGFMKVRHYGFLNPSCSIDLGRIRTMIELAYGFRTQDPVFILQPKRAPFCKLCGGPLFLRHFIRSPGLPQGSFG